MLMQQYHPRTLLGLIYFAITVRGFLDWKVIKKITKYGEEVVLFCGIERCCSESAGWAKHVNDYYSESIFINVQNLKYNSTRKFDGRIGNNGFFLFIRNFSLDDTQFFYSCSYGLNSSVPKILRASMVLEESQISVKITDAPSFSTTTDHTATYISIIAVVSTLLLFVALCFIITAIKLWKKHSNDRIQKQNDDLEMQRLTNDHEKVTSSEIMNEEPSKTHQTCYDTDKNQEPDKESSKKSSSHGVVDCYNKSSDRDKNQEPDGESSKKSSSHGLDDCSKSRSSDRDRNQDVDEESMKEPSSSAIDDCNNSRYSDRDKNQEPDGESSKKSSSHGLDDCNSSRSSGNDQNLPTSASDTDFKFSCCDVS